MKIVDFFFICFECREVVAAQLQVKSTKNIQLPVRCPRCRGVMTEYVYYDDIWHNSEENVCVEKGIERQG